MPVIQAVGQSDVTPGKQDGLGKLLAQHLATCKRIMAKYRWCHQVYHYIDMNAGCGWNEHIDCVGSPLVFLEMAGRAEIPYRAWFIELEPSNALYLQSRAPASAAQYEIRIGDNKEHLPEIVGRIPKQSLGMIYTDPNGLPDFDLLAAVSRLPGCEKMDVLIRYTACAHKRNLRVKPERLVECLGRINKKHWMVREIERGDRWQWTFLLGMNWCGMKDWKRAGFYWAHSDDGQTILERLNYTNSELAERRQPQLPAYRTYEEYLATPEFQAIKAEVWRRCNGMCERCGKRPAVDPHHLRYPKWGTVDVPENITALCRQCHCEAHGKGA